MRRDWFIILLLASATVAILWRVSRHEFVNYDDYAYVSLNPMVQPGLTWPGVKWAFGKLHGEATYWHPFTWLSHMLDCQLFGLRPAGHHLSNLFFHTVNAALLFVLLRRMTGRLGPSAVVAALFALHPLQVDSVAWVAERKNVLSTFFWLLALLAYVRYTARPGWLRYVPVFVCMALGLMAKPTLVTLPCVLLLLDFWPLRRLTVSPQTAIPSPASPAPSKNPNSLGWLLLEKLPLFALSAASSVITIHGHQALGALMSGAELPLSLRLANALVAYVLYLGKLIWPVNLSVFYPHPGRWPIGTVTGSAAVLVVLTALALHQRRSRPYLLVGWLWFVGTLVPTIGLVQAHTQAMADRFAYVPVIGLFVMVVWAATDWTARWRHARFLQAGLAALALGGCGLMTSLQLRHWQNSVTLMQRAAAVASDNSLVRVMLGNALFERGRLDEALAQYEYALRLRPADPNAWQRGGVTLTEQGKPAAAIPYFNNAIQLAPGWPEPRRRLALALLAHGRPSEARLVFQSMVPLFPPTAEGHRDLADMLGEGQQFADALHHYHEALRLNPDFQAALNNLAWLRATCLDADMRDAGEALQLAERACQLSRRRNPHFLGTLAAAYGEGGRFNDATKTIQEAQTLAKASGMTEPLPLFQQMFEHFQADKPFRTKPPF